MSLLIYVYNVPKVVSAIRKDILLLKNNNFLNKL